MNSLRWLITVLVFAAGLIGAFRWPAVFVRITEWAVAGLGIFLALEVVSGLALVARPSVEGIAWGHRWGGHLLVIAVWLVAVSIALGPTIERAVRRRRWLIGLAQGTLGFAAVGLAILTALTGYLGPSHGPIDSMTLQRFRVLHLGVFPALLAVALAGWWKMSRVQDRELRPRATALRSDPPAPTDLENPYRAPQVPLTDD